MLRIVLLCRVAAVCAYQPQQKGRHATGALTGSPAEEVPSGGIRDGA